MVRKYRIGPRLKATLRALEMPFCPSQAAFGGTLIILFTERYGAPSVSKYDSA